MVISRGALLLLAGCAAGTLLVSAGRSQGASPVRLECVADTNVSSFPSERGFNYGASSHARLKGIEMLMLARFDTAPIRGWEVDRATLFLHVDGEDRLRTIGLSTVAVEWEEGQGNGAPADRGATFEWAEHRKRRWGGRQGDFTDAVFTRQGTRAAYSELRRGRDGWIEVDVPGALVEAMAAGASHGLAVSDETGQTRWNNSVHTREQAGFAPYLVVEGSPAALAAPPRPRPAPVRARPAVPTVVELPRPAVPQPAPRRASPTAGLRVWAYGECEKADPITGNLLEEVQLAKAPAGRARERNTVWDGASVRGAGARGETVAFQLCVEPGTGQAAGVQVKPSDLSSPGRGRIPAAAVRLFRDWYVKDGEWYPEVAVPLAGPFSIPDAQNRVPGQRNQSLFVEIQVPRGTPPGVYRGTLNATAQGVASVGVPVVLTVLDFELPDRLSFEVDLNAYGAPGDAETELRYHRLAHEHRATLNILGYSQNGNAYPGYVPPLEGSGQSLRVKDWTEFDRRFGRYFDGSAFAGLPRGSVPVTHAYLPFCEGWPSDIRRHYRFTPTTAAYPDLITEHALRAPPVEEALDETFKQEFQAIVAEFTRHFQAKGWTQTAFQFYLNNKYYYKDPQQGGRGSSWWLLDEPMHRDDWLALRFFGRMFKESVREALGPPSPRDPRMLFRADISRPQWQRDWLDGLVDLMCVSGEFYSKNDLCMDMKRRQRIEFWHYGTGNDIRASNLTAEAWALKAYLAGGDGLLPWDTIGRDDAYEKPTPTAILYPGARFGLPGPLASLRLKALRRGQLDVEYLVLLAKKRGWSREQTAAAVAPLLDLSVRTRERFIDDAGTPLFDNLSSEQLARVRASVAAAISAKPPSGRPRAG
jgi:hypothetical protein